MSQHGSEPDDNVTQEEITQVNGPEIVYRANRELYVEGLHDIPLDLEPQPDWPTDRLEMPLTGMMGSPMTAKRFMEIKHRLRDNRPLGLDTLEAYKKKDVVTTETIFNEVIQPGALDRVETDHVPLTMYVNGERRIVGNARIDGGYVIGYIDKIDGAELHKVISENTLNGVSFGFHINSFKGDE